MSKLLTLEEQLREAENRSVSRERLLSGENEVLKLIVERAALATIFESLTRVAERHGTTGMLCSILLLDKKETQLRHGAAPNLASSYNAAIDGISIGPSAGSCGTAAYLGKPVVVKDISTDPLWADFREIAAEHGLRACWSTPILSSRATVLGTFAVYYREVREPDPEDYDVIQMLARTAALAIEHADAEQNLAESEERFRSLSRCSPVGIFTLDVDGAFTYVNPKFREISGFDYEKTLDYWLESAADATARTRVVEECSKAVRDRAEFSCEFPLANGCRWVSLRCAPMSSSAGGHMGYVGTLEAVSEQKQARATG